MAVARCVLAGLRACTAEIKGGWRDGADSSMAGATHDPIRRAIANALRNGSGRQEQKENKKYESCVDEPFDAKASVVR